MNSLAVLFSGGLDSAILLADSLRKHSAVHPLYVRCGLIWETVEFDYMRNFLGALRCPALKPLTILDQPVVDLYGPHWSITGKDVPDAASADEAVFLPGRNVLLLAKALLWCHLQKVPALAVGSLSSNPFPDASASFFQGYQDLVNQAMHGSVTVRLPLAGRAKTEVMQLAKGLPMEHTFSCLSPIKSQHCGNCNKCAERKRAFGEAGLADPTVYAPKVITETTRVVYDAWQPPK